MTFDKAIEKIADNAEFTGTPDEVEGSFVDLALVTYIVESLRDEYAPTIEMTKKQKDWFLFNKKQGFAFAETVADIYRDEVVMTIHDDKFWGADMTEEQLMRAWLHPESIKAVE